MKDKLSKRAEKSEKNAFSSLKKSANSGRSKQDGDFKTAEICFDNKLQTTATDWKVKVSEMNKVKADAFRCGRKYAALVIENKLGDRIVAMDFDSFTDLLIQYGITGEEEE